MAMVITSPSKSAMVRLMPSMATEPWDHPLADVLGNADLSVQSVVCLSKWDLLAE